MKFIYGKVKHVIFFWNSIVSWGIVLFWENELYQYIRSKIIFSWKLKPGRKECSQDILILCDYKRNSSQQEIIVRTDSVTFSFSLGGSSGFFGSSGSFFPPEPERKRTKYEYAQVGLLNYSMIPISSERNMHHKKILTTRVFQVKMLQQA